MRFRVFMLSMILCLTAVKLFAVVSDGVPQSNEGPPVVRAVAAAYPAVAMGARISGSVIVEVKINAKGEVTSADAVGGHKLLRKDAERAARRWTFAPTHERDKTRMVRLTFEFIVMPEDAPYADLLPVFMPPYRVEVRDAPGRIVANE